MSELGEQLKRAREEKQISLDEIQELTKIQKRYLQAIENGDFDKLPGAFYTKAFIKSYAEAVGLNYEALIQEFGHELPRPSQPTESLPPRRLRPTIISPARSKFTSILSGLLVFFIVIGIFAIIWMVSISSNDDNTLDEASETDNEQNVVVEQNKNAISDDEHKAEPIREKDDKKDDEDKNEVVQNEPDNRGNLEKVSVSGDTTNFILSGTDEFQVDFTFHGDSWLKIQGGSGKLYVNKGFSNGDKATFDFRDEQRVRIRIGSTPSMKMFVNGEEVELEQQPVAQTVKIEFQKQSSY